MGSIVKRALANQRSQSYRRMVGCRVLTRHCASTAGHSSRPMCSVLALYMRQLSVPGCRLNAHCTPRCPHSIERNASGRALTPAHHPVTAVSCSVNIMQHSGRGASLDYISDGAAVG